jgi:hypothetical protein
VTMALQWQLHRPIQSFIDRLAQGSSLGQLAPVKDGQARYFAC